MELLLHKYSHPQANRTMANEAVLETVVMTYGDDGILRITINEGASIGIQQTRLQLETIRRICGDAKIPVLIDARASHHVSTEAKEFTAQNVGNRIATAVISSNPLTKISVNIFVSVFRPSTPYRVFSNEAKAEKWLSEQLIKSRLSK